MPAPAAEPDDEEDEVLCGAEREDVSDVGLGERHSCGPHRIAKEPWAAGRR